MNFKKTGCCAIEEITYLSGDGDPEDSMSSFCKQNLMKQLRFGGTPAAHNTLFSFYMFTSAVSNSGKGMYGAKDYGNNFADFIEKHKFGTVWRSPVVKNVAFHDGHSNQVFIWAPNLKTISAWWKEEQSEAKSNTCVYCRADLDDDGECSDRCGDNDWDDDRDEDEDD